jgi:hypothetical protein
MSTHHARRLSRACFLAVLVAGACGGWFASAAFATNYTYCGASYMSGGDCYGARHSITSNETCYSPAPPACTFLSGHSVGASALDTSLVQYGSWYFGSNGVVCHPYAGDHLLYPWLYNSDGSSQSMMGRAWYSEPPPQDGFCS